MNARFKPLLCLVLMAVLFRTDAVLAKDQPTTLRVLFVGNSYIYVNDLPMVVARVAASRGLNLQTAMLALPNFAIEDHIRNGGYTQALSQGWDWVVLQQGPSTLPQNQQHLRIWARRAALEAQQSGAKVALMSAWPAVVNLHTSFQAEESYRAAAIGADACVFPVATAWRLSGASSTSIELYDADGLHPSKSGTLLAALVIARGILPGPYFPDAPTLESFFPEDDWSSAVSAVTALDRVANESEQSEFARCRLDK